MLRVHSQKLGHVSILCVQGQIVIGETDALRNAVSSQSNVSTLVLDLARVSRVDARGLGVLLELREQTQAHGIDFKLMRPTKLVQHVLELTCLNTVFKISSAEDILAGASRGQPMALAGTALCA